MGHTFVKRHPDDIDFKGICPYHGDCLEGLVAGPTFEARFGKRVRRFFNGSYLGCNGLLSSTSCDSNNIDYTTG